MSPFPFATWQIILAFIAIILILAIVKIVPQGYNYTVEFFGKYDRTILPGINFIIPFVERIGARVNMMENFLDIPPQNVITKDNATMRVDGVVFYRVRDAFMATYKVTDLRGSIQYLAMTNIRTVLGSMNLDESLEKRDVINSKLLKVIDLATDPWGVLCTRIEIKDIAPPESIKKAMEEQLTSERKKRAAILLAEGDRESEIKRAEGERRAIILKAEGDKNEKILSAEGRLKAAHKDAEARERLSKAEAFATTTVSKAIDEGNMNSIQYFMTLKYVKAFEVLAESSNSKFIVLPTNMSEMTGLVSKLSDFWKSQATK